jgi:hypothetical protein
MMKKKSISLSFMAIDDDCCCEMKTNFSVDFQRDHSIEMYRWQFIAMTERNNEEKKKR